MPNRLIGSRTAGALVPGSFLPSADVRLPQLIIMIRGDQTAEIRAVGILTDTLPRLPAVSVRPGGTEGGTAMMTNCSCPERSDLAWLFFYSVISVCVIRADISVSSLGTVERCEVRGVRSAGQLFVIAG